VELYLEPEKLRSKLEGKETADESLRPADGLRRPADDPRKGADDPRKGADDPRRSADDPRRSADHPRSVKNGVFGPPEAGKRCTELCDQCKVDLTVEQYLETI